ncbi:hypothetical protein BS47DRAFT_1360548 [Hydnum rufescens UP504]|uniref:Uncharacterized protein n=1 Tax=Hydnum rufescens UP504 TaxID=1448309 RepID=A0A9P6B1V4_9AGAM|nr:hypothetical protein BS47DRAFT_1360548 [Hydnum rufescens UP504]
MSQTCFTIPPPVQWAQLTNVPLFSGGDIEGAPLFQMLSLMPYGMSTSYIYHTPASADIPNITTHLPKQFWGAAWVVARIGGLSVSSSVKTHPMNEHTDEPPICTTTQATPETTINERVYHTPAEAGPFPIPQYAQPPKPPPEMTIDGTAYHTPTKAGPFPT